MRRLLLFIGAYLSALGFYARRDASVFVSPEAVEEMLQAIDDQGYEGWPQPRSEESDSWWAHQLVKAYGTALLAASERLGFGLVTDRATPALRALRDAERLYPRLSSGRSFEGLAQDVHARLTALESTQANEPVALQDAPVAVNGRSGTTTPRLWN